MDYRKIEKHITCPFNSCHQILPHRMPQHLIKCRKNHIDVDLKPCLFNAVHLVPEAQYNKHLTSCVDRKLAEQNLFKRPHTEGLLAQPVAFPKDEGNSLCYISEDWERDLVKESYKPEKHINNMAFTRPPPSGLSKGARKKWRLGEIERVNSLLSGEPPQPRNSENASFELLTDGLQEDAAAAGPSAPVLEGELGEENSTHEEEDKEKNRKCRGGIKTDEAIPASTNSQTSDNGSPQEPHNSNKTSEIVPNKKMHILKFIKEKQELEIKLSGIKKLEHLKVSSNEPLTDKEEAEILMKKQILDKLSGLTASFDLFHCK